MKSVMFSLLVSSSLFATKGLREENIFDQYKTTAINLAQQANSGAQVESLKENTNDLLALGLKIMSLYGQKNSLCQNQYQYIGDHFEEFYELSLEEIHHVFHDGFELPKAPASCYLGRSIVVHPLMNQIRLKGEFSDAQRVDAVDEYLEVARHIIKIKKNIEAS